MNTSHNHKFTIALTISFVLSLLLYIFLCWDFFNNGRSNFKSPGETALTFTLHAVPVFFLQLLTLRLEKQKWLRWLPSALFAVAILVGVLYIVCRWNALIGLLLLGWCAPLAAGICLGWRVSGKKAFFIPSIVCLILFGWVYWLMKNMGSLQFDLFDLPSLAILGAGVFLLIRKSKPDKAL